MNKIILLPILFLAFACSSDEMSDNTNSIDPIIGTWKNNNDNFTVIFEESGVMSQESINSKPEFIKENGADCIVNTTGTFKNISSEMEVEFGEKMRYLMQYYQFDLSYQLTNCAFTIAEANIEAFDDNPVRIKFNPDFTIFSWLSNADYDTVQPEGNFWIKQ